MRTMAGIMALIAGSSHAAVIMRADPTNNAANTAVAWNETSDFTAPSSDSTTVTIGQFSINQGFIDANNDQAYYIGTAGITNTATGTVTFGTGAQNVAFTTATLGYFTFSAAGRVNAELFLNNVSFGVQSPVAGAGNRSMTWDISTAAAANSYDLSLVITPNGTAGDMLIRQNLGGFTVNGTISPIPEPSATLLGGLGFLALLPRRRA